MAGNSSELKKYRQEILNLILNDKTICELVLNKSIPVLDESTQKILTSENIYDYAYVPDVQDNEKTYIAFDLRGKTSSDTNLYKNMSLYIYIFSHTNIIRDTATGYLRTDLIDERLQYLLNDNENFGIGIMSCESDDMLRAGDHFYGRQLVFRVKDMNKDNCR